MQAKWLKQTKITIKAWITLISLWFKFFKWDAIAYYLIYLLIPITTIINAFVGGSFINLVVSKLQAGQDIFSFDLIKLLLLQAILWIIDALANTLGGYFDRKFSTHRESFHDSILGSKIAKTDPALLENPKIARLIAKVSANLWHISGIAYNLIFGIVWFIATLVISFLVAKFNIWLLIGAISTIFIKAIINIKFGARNWNIWDSAADDKLKYQAYNLLAYENDPSSKLYLNTLNIGPWALKKSILINYNFSKQIIKNEKKRTQLVLAIEIINTLIWIFMFVILFKQIAAKTLPIGAFYTIYTLLNYNSLYAEYTFSNLANLLSETNLHKDFYKLLQLLENKKENTTNLPKALHTSPRSIAIKFKHVYFKYPKTNNFVLKDISFEIKPKSKVALVGKNGAGKTTIIKLLTKMYTPNKGKIFINNIPLSKISKSWIYNHIGLLVQNTPKLRLPVKEVISASNLPQDIFIPTNIFEMQTELAKKSKDFKINHKKLIAATKLANIYKQIEKLPNKFNTWLNTSIPGGVDISGGQWQKLLLAQIFYKDPLLLILDEPTSAIDSLAELEIFNNLFAQAKTKTVLIVSHRFATVKRAEHILVLDNGKIVEQGSHKSLMSQNGLYAKMYKAGLGEGKTQKE